MREENVAVNAAFLRVLASPVPATATVDEVCDALGRHGTTLQPVLDPDIDCAVWNATCRDAGAALVASANVLVSSPLGGVFLFDVQGVADAGVSLENEHGAALAKMFDAPCAISRRTMPASAWTPIAPIALGLSGFEVRIAPPPDHDTPAWGSVFRGWSLTFSAPTVLLKVGLNGVPGSALARICHAVGDAHGGLLHIGAYPGISVRTGEPIMLLECSDVIKSPLHRALDLIDIECARYGGTVGSAVALSYIPLEALTGTLAARMGLDAQSAQIIETRLREAEPR
jgi:hypothetical protein